MGLIRPKQSARQTEASARDYRHGRGSSPDVADVTLMGVSTTRIRRGGQGQDAGETRRLTLNHYMGGVMSVAS